MSTFTYNLTDNINGLLAATDIQKVWTGKTSLVSYFV